MGFPKALLEYGGATFLDGLIRAFAAHCSPVVAVLGCEAERIREGLAAGDLATLVVNPDYKLGQITSMQCGLQAVPADAAGVLFTLVDHPRARSATVEALLGHSEPLVIPRYQGRRGHPVWFAASLIAEFLELDAGQTARVVLERHAVQIRYVDIEDPCILDDVDDPEAYRRLVGG